MPRMYTRYAQMGIVFTLMTGAAACTQAPAMVELKGGQSFTRNGSLYAASPRYSGPISSSGANTGSYVTAAPAPVATTHVESGTVAHASVGAIGVSELAPPSSGSQPAPVNDSPFKPARQSDLAPAAGGTPPAAGIASKPAPVNPWTGRAREVVLKGADDHGRLYAKPEPKKTEAAASRLDSIISSEGPAASVTAAKTESGDFMWPVNSRKVISAYGPKGKGKANDGINIASANGEPVWAASDGEVIYVGNELQGYGNMVLIKHSGDKSTAYAHLSRATVDKYDRVKQGDIIGYVGTSGNVKDPQLHFAVRDGKDPVDPLKFLQRNVASLR